MFRCVRFNFNLSTFLLVTALLAYPSGALAQRGGGGGHVGGGTAGGGGLSNVGKATGVDDKDGLKDFRAAMAVQATGPQVVEYAAMMKSTEVASAELKNFLLQLAKENGAPELAGRTTAVKQAIEQARTENKKFLDGFSEPQKSGLKEIGKRLLKADFDLAQQAKALDLEAGNSKAIGQPITASAQTLDRVLTIFQTQQVGLGEEMGIGNGKSGADFAFNLGPLKRSITVDSQPVAITISEVISNGVASGGQSTFKLQLTADLSDLQQNITDVLHSQLDQADRCGERIAVQGATLTPSEPASVVVVQLHFERWTCMGREANEMVEGTGTFEVKLMLSVGDEGALRLTPEIGRVDAPGLIGEWLRSGSPGEGLRDKIADSILSAISQGSDFNATLPPAARGNATLYSARFQGSGSGKLWVVLGGEIRVSNEQVASLISELKAGELKADESKTPELKRQSSAPEAVQETVPR
jgi:hypothetical protein